MSLASEVWKTTKRKVGFYGALAAVGGGVYLVYNMLNPEEQYKVGPLGKKSHVQVSQPIFQGDNTTKWTCSGFAYALTRVNGWNQLSESRRNYINQAITNYQWGYSFANGDVLLQAVLNCWYYGIKANITWPLPKAE